MRLFLLTSKHWNLAKMRVLERNIMQWWGEPYYFNPISKSVRIDDITVKTLLEPPFWNWAIPIYAASSSCARMQDYIYIYIYIYSYVNNNNKKTKKKPPAVYYHTARKSPAECILLLSSCTSKKKTPPVWFATSSKLYRQSDSLFSIRATWSPGPQNIVLRYAKYLHAASAQNYLSFTACIVVVVVYWTLI